MPRKLVVSTFALAAFALAATPGTSPAANPTGSWSGGKTSESYYFSPSLTIARSGSRYIGTSTAPVSWSPAQGQQGVPPIGSASCTIPAGTQVLKLRRFRGRRNSYLGSMILIYNLLTTAPGQPTPVPFACQTHLFGAIVSLSRSGKTFRLRSIDGPDTFPTVAYRKG